MESSHHLITPILNGKKMFCFGFGYIANFLAPKLFACDWNVSGTTTDPDKKPILKDNDINTWLFDRRHNIIDPFNTLNDVTHVLLSVPTDTEGDPVFDAHGIDLASLKNLEWVGYLSTTAIYGNHDGNWVDETTPPMPTTPHGLMRLKAEQQWQSLCINEGLPLHIFRISGIYGPGRNVIDALRSGTARCIEKPGHFFNRIYVEDIVQVLIASINAPNPGSIYNLTDDMPSTCHEMIQFACNLIGINSPPLLPFDQAELAPVVRGFYRDNKRVCNDKIKDEFDINLLYPDYRRGLLSCLKEEKETAALLRFFKIDLSAD
ncbi:MAG: SDR family oxidoreductase [Alphaproteobacteria bacterium]|nr:SDR family oxidoreductase [Alphaproteobacteria bacterium]MCK5556645.1 SDR family oxidoreductase [Alphaproteobacteria bacterium]